MNFVDITDNRVTTRGKKDFEKLHLSRELTNLFNMKLSMIPAVVGSLATVSKVLGKKNRRKWRPEEELRLSSQQHC